jgi:hypothetical protein
MMLPRRQNICYDSGTSQEVQAGKPEIKDLSPADLYVVNVAASQEVWMRTLQRKHA